MSDPTRVHLRFTGPITSTIKSADWPRTLEAVTTDGHADDNLLSAVVEDADGGTIYAWQRHWGVPLAEVIG